MNEWFGPLLRELLLVGGPWEVDPVERPRCFEAAERLLSDPRLSDEQRQRVRRVWIEEPEAERAEGERLRAEMLRPRAATATADLPQRAQSDRVRVEDL